MDSSVLVEDGVVWDHEDQESVMYSDDVEETLIENNNETYLTTNEGDETEYFSVLENSNTDLSMDLNDVNDVETEEDENHCTTMYAIEGSSDLCAVSVTRDSNGVLRRFRINLRVTGDGEYESLPETMELLPFEDEEEEEEDEESEGLPQQQLIVKQEPQEPFTECDRDLAEVESNSNESDDEQLHVAENDETLRDSPIPAFLPIRKMETHAFEDEITSVVSNPESYSDLIEEEYISANAKDLEEIGDRFFAGNDDEDDYVRRKALLRDFAGSNSLEIVQTNDSDEDIENDADYFNELQTNSDDFEIVDGVHITGDLLESSEDDVNEEVQPEMQVLKSQAQILNVNKKSVQKPGAKTKKQNVIYYVVKHAQKENLASVSQKNSNPRSLLKSSFKEASVKQKVPPRIERRGKPKLCQSDAYYSTLAKTTIVQAPIRQQRLPRKQTITPVQRGDEEIIVQEVVVSSNGFVETTQNGVVKSKVPLKASAFVQLSDSDDYDPKNEVRRRKKHKKRKSQIAEIVITDSEDDDSLPKTVEIDLRDDSSDSEAKSEPRKRSKKKRNSSLDSDTPSEARSATPPTVGVSTRNSVRALQELNGGEKPAQPEIVTKWKCDICSKVFPSQGSLESHAQSHCFTQTTRRQTLNINRHECTKCDEKFKNTILLSKHMKTHEISKSLECGICKKIFVDRNQLASHKRVHIKQQMFNATTLPVQSPKPSTSKVLPTKPSSKASTLKQSSKTSHKCEHCQKVFSTAILLTAHIKSHKLFICSSCNSTFISKLALENHVRKSCVKKVNTRMSLMQKGRAPISSPPKRETKNAPYLLICEKCSASFQTHTALYKHKVIKHGLETPDKKEILENTSRVKSLRKRLTTHGNVPASKKLQKAHTEFLNKMSEFY